MTTDSNKPELIPAAENVWDNLLTIAGEVPSGSWIEDLKNRKKIIAANRRYWNGYFHHYLDKEERSHFGNSLPILDDKELAHIDQVMAKRGFDSLPTDVSTIELSFVDAGAKDLVLDGFCFQFLTCIAFKTRGSVELNRAKIDYLVDLAEAKVYGHMNFMGAKIDNSINLDQVQIGGRICFDQAHIGGSIRCRHTSAKDLGFATVTCQLADFTDAHFDGPCNFVGTKFNEVPKFFGTQLHEDTNWRGVKWPKAATDREKAAERIRRYDRLRLMMSQLKKPAEEQRFQALSLREQRMRDGVTLPSLLNWLYDHGWEYGYGLSRAIGLWLGHILLGAVAIGFTQASATGSWVDKLVAKVVEPVTWLSVSFSNSMPFLGLHRGGLVPLYEQLNCPNAAATSLCAFGVLWAVQGVLGTVLFFFLLVTVRNVYRL